MPISCNFEVVFFRHARGRSPVSFGAAIDSVICRAALMARAGQSGSVGFCQRPFRDRWGPRQRLLDQRR